MIIISCDNQAIYDTKRAELLAMPNIDPEIRAVALGTTVTNEATGRALTDHPLSAQHCDWLQAQGFRVNIGSLNGPEWGTEEQA